MVSLTLKEQKQQFLNTLNWSALSCNTNSEAVALLKDNLDKVVWYKLSSNINSEAIALLKDNLDKVDLYGLSYNKSSEAVALLKANLDKVDWYMLCGNSNPDAIQMIIDKINAFDYIEISKRYTEKNICVIEYFNHPRFVNKFIELHDMEDLTADAVIEWIRERNVVSY